MLGCKAFDELFPWVSRSALGCRRQNSLSLRPAHGTENPVATLPGARGGVTGEEGAERS